MIDRQNLLSDLQSLLRKLEADLLERSTSSELTEVSEALKAEHQNAQKAERTAQSYEDWRSDYITQIAAAWVLSCVFARFLEDNQLIDPPKIAGPKERRQRALDEHELYFRAYPKKTDREYLLQVFDDLTRLPGAKEIFGQHNPIHQLPQWLSGDAAGELLKFFQKIDANSGALVHDFTDSNWDTRFLGDLYQDLSEAARKKYALLQTPEFVEEFILDRTLDPAIDEFGLDGFRMIDPACGSGHFLLGSFRRLVERWQRKEPGTNVRVLVQRALDSVHGVDVNPYAIAIARVRLLLAALRECGIQRLQDAPDFHFNLAVGDSLLHGVPGREQRVMHFHELAHHYQSEDLPTLQRILVPGMYHAVVANPPYITPKDRALNEAYRNRYDACHMKYSLAVPFMERIFQLAVTGGYTGQITANSFMKREFGKKLIEEFIPKIDLTHVIDTSGGGGAHIPGHKTGTVILFGRHRKPIATTIRAVMGIRGEPSTPQDPSRGLVWSAIISQLDQPGSQNEFISVADLPRESFHKHPWSIGGGGAAELKEDIDSHAMTILADHVSSIGPPSFAGIDDMFFSTLSALRTHGIERLIVRPLCTGDVIRDWYLVPDTHCIVPYDHNHDLIPFDEHSRWGRYIWLTRRCSEGMVSFNKQTRKELREPWWSWYRWIPERFRAPFSITYAEVSTHNHFVLDRGGKVFKQTAPVIKLPSNATEDDYLAFLGLLNSSTACFWMKQVAYPKATSTGDISVEKGKPEANRYAFAATGLEKFPVPFQQRSEQAQTINRITSQLDRLAVQLSNVLPTSIVKSWKERNGKGENLRFSFREGQGHYQQIRKRMIALQEELDWEIYLQFGLCDLGACEDILRDNDNGISEDARPFLWEQDTAPESVPSMWREPYERRWHMIHTSAQIALIETPVFKRPWWGRQGVYGRLARDYEGWTSEALATWLLDRLESYFDFDGRMNEEVQPTAKLDIALISVARLADVARQDTDFMQVGELYRDDPAFDVQKLVIELVESESVPLLLVLRYKDTGLRKRAEWERTWELQREEDRLTQRRQDAKEEELSASAPLREIPVPSKYTSADFQSSSYWRLRGKLDVPKERWVSFPYCEGEDGTLMIAWAGYGPLQLARAIGTYHADVKERLGGGEDLRLVPLLACLIELLPWLKQWHNDVDPEYGVPMGDYFEGFIQEEAKQMGKTIGEIKAWKPPSRTGKQSHAKTRRRKEATNTA